MKFISLLLLFTLSNSVLFGQKNQVYQIFRKGNNEIDSFVLNRTLRAIDNKKIHFFLDDRKYPLHWYYLSSNSIKEIRLQYAKSAQKQFNDTTLQGVFYVTTYPNTKFTTLSSLLKNKGFTLDSSTIVEIYINNQIVPKQDAYLDAKAYIELAPDETNPKASTKVFVWTLTPLQRKKYIR